LEAAHPVEQDRDGSEVGVFAQRELAVVCGLGRGFDKTDLVAGLGVYAVQVLERIGGEAEMIVEVSEDHGDDTVT